MTSAQNGQKEEVNNKKEQNKSRKGAVLCCENSAMRFFREEEVKLLSVQKNINKVKSDNREQNYGHTEMLAQQGS